MQTGELKSWLAGKYIICACEGNAEEAIINLLLDHDKLCFKREALIRGKCTQLRKSKDIANEYLNQEFERGIVILRILDRDKENFTLPRPYNMNKRISVINVVTKPEIEILHIKALGLEQDFEHCKRLKKDVKPSEFLQGYFSKQKNARIKNVKSMEFSKALYADGIDKLLDAIKRYNADGQKANCLRDLLV